MSELVLHRDTEQITRIVEAADQVVAGGAHVVDVAILDERMRVTDVERHVGRRRTASSERNPLARAVGNTRIARKITSRVWSWRSFDVLSYMDVLNCTATQRCCNRIPSGMV